MAQANRNRRSAPDRWSLASGLIAALWLTASGTALAEAVGTVTHSSGTVSVKRADGTSKLLGLRSEVHEGDQISTERNTYTRVKFNDGGEITLRPNTQVQVANYSFKENQPAKDNMVISLFKGGLRAVTGLLGKRNRDNVAFRTPTATIGIRGTNFGLLFCQNDCADVPTVSGQAPANGLHLDVANGEIVASNAGGAQNFTGGQFGFVGSADLPPVLVPPAEGVRVTVPSSFKAGGSGQGVGKDGANECSIQ